MKKLKYKKLKVILEKELQKKNLLELAEKHAEMRQTEDKWLNRRSVEAGVGLESVFTIPEEEEKQKKHLWLLLLFLLIGGAIAAPIILTLPAETTGIPTPNPIPGTTPTPPLVVAEVDLPDYKFSVSGWQPNNEKNHYYLVNRPDDPTKDNFQTFPLSVTSTMDSRGATELTTPQNQNLTSKYFSYSLDIDRKNACEVDLKSEILRRSELEDGNSEKINIPAGYSLDKLITRYQGVYCTFYKRTRTQLIEEIKNPYVAKPDTSVRTTDDTPLISLSDSPYIYRGAWYEHDAAKLGKYGLEYQSASDYPNKFRYRFKREIPGELLSTIGDDQLDNFNPAVSGILKDDREGYSIDFFYRHFASKPYGDVGLLYEDSDLSKLNEFGEVDQFLPKTLTRPGTGVNRQNNWANRYYRDFDGDVGFSSNATRELVRVYTPTQLTSSGTSLQVVPTTHPSDKPFNVIWNGALVENDVPSNFFYAVESTRTKFHSGLNVDGESKPSDFLIYLMRSSFDNSRNRSMNANFSKWAGDTTDQNRFAIYDAATHGKRAGLGRFTYESISIATRTNIDDGQTKLTGLRNLDMRIFEETAFETALPTDCLNVVSGSIYEEICPTTKDSLINADGNVREVYIPTKDNLATNYYAELLEINELWDLMMKKLAIILEQDKYVDLEFEAVRNLLRGDVGTLQTFFDKRSTFVNFLADSGDNVLFKSNNFLIFEALSDLFDNELNDLLIFSDFPLMSADIKSKAQRNLLALSGSITALVDYKNDSGSITFDKNTLLSGFNSVVMNLTNLVDFYAKTEAERKLDQTYTLNVTNTDSDVFNYQIQGRKLPYVHYVRLMKMSEAIRKFGTDVFDIYKWDRSPTRAENIAVFLGDNGGVTKRVSVNTATQSELAYYVIHILKDENFPWVPVDYKEPNSAFTNLGGVEDIDIATYGTKFDGYLDQAETYINYWMNNYYVAKEGVTRRIRSFADDTGGASLGWKDFDVVKTDTKSGQRALSIYDKSTLFTNGETIKSDLFTSYKHNQISLRDFLFYTQASYLKQETITTHCITTYELTEEQKKDTGYVYVKLPTLDENNTDDPTKLLSYVYVPIVSSTDETTGKTHFKVDTTRNTKWETVYQTVLDDNRQVVRQAVYETPTTLTFREDYISKLVHIFFSYCISDEQYNAPINVGDQNYQTTKDEWEPLTKETQISFRWDRSDLIEPYDPDKQS